MARSSGSSSERPDRAAARSAAGAGLPRLRRLLAGRSPRGGRHAPLPGGRRRQSGGPALARPGGAGVARRRPGQGRPPGRRRPRAASSSPPARPRPTTWRSAGVASRAAGRHVVTSAVEHVSVRNPCRDLEKQGWSVTWLPVDGDGARGSRRRRPRAAARHRAGLDHGRQRRDRHAAAGARDRPRGARVAACRSTWTASAPSGGCRSAWTMRRSICSRVSSNDLYGPPGRRRAVGRGPRCGWRRSCSAAGRRAAFARAPRTCRRSSAWAWPPTSRATSARPRSRDCRRCGIGCWKGCSSASPARRLTGARGAGPAAAPRQRGRARREGRRRPAGARLRGIAASSGSACNLTTGEPSHVLRGDRLRARGGRGLALLHARAGGRPPPRWTRCSTCCPASSTACGGSPRGERASPRLFLFDIDGTLVTARRRGPHGALPRAGGDLRRHRSHRCLRLPRQDRSAHRARPHARRRARRRADRRAASPACFAAYVAELEAAHRRRRARASHARHRRRWCARWPRATTSCVGLLTGNIETGARVKLRADRTVAAVSGRRVRLRRHGPPAAAGGGVRAGAGAHRARASPSTRSRSSATRRSTSTARARAARGRRGGDRASTPPPT